MATVKVCDMCDETNDVVTMSYEKDLSIDLCNECRTDLLGKAARSPLPIECAMAFMIWMILDEEEDDCICLSDYLYGGNDTIVLEV